MADENASDYVENLQLQLSEIEMLRSMFPDEEEFRLDDQGIIAEVQKFILDNSNTLPPRITFCLRVEAETGESGGNNSTRNDVFVSEIYCSLPHEYPNEKPELFVRSPQSLDRGVQKDLNKDLDSHLSVMDSGELRIVPAIQWLQENGKKYIGKCKKRSNSHGSCNVDEEESSFVRMWMYMHHIYSKTKRKIIVDWSSDYNLTGFSLPGKPGVVCIEGEESNVEEYYSKLRRLNWKKITCRHRETGNKQQNIQEQRMFQGFEELTFDVHGTREGHMDMGQFFHYLEKHNLGKVFHVLFGVEGK